MDMHYTQSSESGVPSITSHQRSQPHADPLQGHPSTDPAFPPPQDAYRTPHQYPPGTHARPEGLAPVLTGPSPQPASAPQRGSFLGHQHVLSNVHPHLHTVHSPPFVFPSYSPRQEENMRHLAYVSPSMMITHRPHAPVYQYQTSDHFPTTSHIFSPTVSAPTSPIYPHAPTNVSPPQNSPANGSSSTPYATHGAYTSVEYSTPPSYTYPSPTSFVPGLSIYGPHRPPPHYARPYGFPNGQESQGMWWYSPPGAATASNSFEGTQREFQQWSKAGYPPAGQLEGEQPGQRNTVSLPSEPQLRRPTDRTRGRPLNDEREEAKQEPFSTTSPKNKHQKRRSYHPNPPAHRSDWVMWAGNVPSDVTHDELREFFNQRLPPLSPTQTEPPKDRQQVYGGVSTVFLISRSSCAFVNFESEAQLEAATARFNGQPIRPHDQRCPRLVCRVRRREDDLMAGVGAQRGNAMHIKWVKDQKAKAQREHADTVGSPKDIVGPSSPSSVSSDDSREAEEGRVSAHANLSRSPSIASTSSDILTRYFPQRYFILKSSTQYDLDLSVQKNIWATQRHNEEILDQAYRTSKDVFLIFSVNKSGGFYGYARMAGPVLQDEIGVLWASATGCTALPSVFPDDTGAKQQQKLHILPPDEHPYIKQSPHSAPADQPLFASAEPRIRVSPSTDVPVQTSSSEFGSDAPYHVLENGSTRESAGHDAISAPTPVDHEVPEPYSDDRPKFVSEVPFEGHDPRDDGPGPAWDRPFRIEWIRTDPLPFFRTRHLRNPWNHGREAKVSRDGTELEPTVGQQLLDEWDKPYVAVDNPPGPSRTRRGPKSTRRPP
ncbi:YT521-B-like domain-containing protein [Lactarius akahatsu]|uniref:YT521-B-like domain-containing protein n=1 Tax=Lactarius akahatsu TaxID=416441 RepID=A0AAD4L7Z3_9AGAM|nr:YT521-B-like domain-containing protein [Lactarius akahatsu]